jgi:hypothetical protein
MYNTALALKNAAFDVNFNDGSAKLTEPIHGTTQIQGQNHASIAGS